MPNTVPLSEIDAYLWERITRGLNEIISNPFHVNYNGHLYPALADEIYRIVTEPRHNKRPVLSGSSPRWIEEVLRRLNLYVRTCIRATRYQITTATGGGDVAMLTSYIAAWAAFSTAAPIVGRLFMPLDAARNRASLNNADGNVLTVYSWLQVVWRLIMFPDRSDNEFLNALKRLEEQPEGSPDLQDVERIELIKQFSACLATIGIRR